MEFIHTARELQIYSIKKCSNFPKRYTFYISQPIANSATRIHEYVKMANSVYPTNAHEARRKRRGFWLPELSLHWRYRIWGRCAWIMDSF